ncbi:PG0541 family transporter-associated protein [Desulfocurvibacter africanus]|uniref:PG0541 family transporter-associated protein n=1 Tax=Desulfocurvibacter africanus TaxID=873 RepID=UPI00040A5DA1|nr:PG0541 family transporter-associated protein [Desulfocurvibacter africanus]
MPKLVHIFHRFEFKEAVEAILDRHGIDSFVRLPMAEGRDKDGKHHGSQVFPGNMSLVQALVDEERIDGLLEELRRFKQSRPAHEHLRVTVVTVERTL